MITVSSTSVSGWEMIVNSGFGNRCVICGNHFDDGGICNLGHEQGATYYAPPSKAEPEAAKPEVMSTHPVANGMVTCHVFGSCRCTICGGYFADGDTVCTGGHEIDCQYPSHHRMVS